MKQVQKHFFSSLCKGMLDPKENGRALAPVHFYKAEAPCAHCWAWILSYVKT